MKLRRLPPLTLATTALLSLTPALIRAASAPDPLRLTREIEPIAEAVQLIIDPAQDTFSRSGGLDLVAHRELTSFRLHALGPVLSAPATHR